METTRVLIVEDEALFREMLSRTLAAEPGLEVVGVATEGKEAVRLAAELIPDAVIMDIALPGGMDGIDAALQIKAQRKETGIVILSVHKDRRYVSSLPLSESPGWAYLLKQTVPDLSSVMRAIQGSVDGLVVLDPAVVETLQPRRGSAAARLTPRHRQVLELIAQGYNNTAIAQKLSLTEKSVETYINSIYQVLQIPGEEGVHARVKATLVYLEDSLGNA
ncbi:MAG: response regulator transcription factor [Chloroflexi bacterium]|nr:response regulator transcription factor [Chloroflexota bacterium]MCH8349339.1 response regulator transcription factor [Chloroflexota bacterium]MCI0781219.1 response regulator transcription factor [Chloroflexota bacterium]MCI0786766.1 response regulator transcription factor [Chloroflexota bacterium]MCI0793957.1 response regulator transcription factor [Chloroflexota bacterium]